MTALQTGLSLALVGLMATAIQGGLSRVVIPKLGERRTAVLALAMSGLALAGYGLAPHGRLACLIIPFGSIGGLWQPSLRGLISRTVGPHEQGGTQGLLSSLTGVAGILGPPLSTGHFGYFISQSAPVREKARERWDSALGGTEGIGLAWVVVVGFIRIATHRAVLVNPMTPLGAMPWARGKLRTVCRSVAVCLLASRAAPGGQEMCCGHRAEGAQGFPGGL